MDLQHYCAVSECEAEIKPTKFMCSRHWYQLPEFLRDRMQAAKRFLDDTSATAEKHVDSRAEAERDRAEARTEALDWLVRQ